MILFLVLHRIWSIFSSLAYESFRLFNVQDLLMDVRDKLLFEPEYAGNLKENIAPKSPLRIPWAWLPAALCLLQEVLLLIISLQMSCVPLYLSALVIISIGTLPLLNANFFNFFCYKI